MAAQRRITVTGGTLFRVAADYLGDATQWTRIVEATPGLPPDPWITGTVTVVIPARDGTGGTGGILAR